jgi:hypothetical protein
MFARIIKTLFCLALISSFNVAFAKPQKFPLPAFAPDHTAYDGRVVYLLSTTQKKVYRWSVGTSDYLAPLDVGIDQNGTRLAPSKIAVSPTQKRLYLGYSTGAIRFIPLSGDPIEVAFATTPLGVSSMAMVGKYLLAQDNSGAWATHFIFNESGVMTDSREWNSYASEYTWDAKNSRVLYFQDYLSPNSLVYEVIDQATGKISSYGTSSNPSYDYNQKPIRLSPDNKYVLVGNGTIYKNPSLSVAGNLGFQIADAIWNSDGSLVTLQNAGDSTILQKRDANFRLIEQQTYGGAVLGLYASGSKTSVLTIKNGLVTPYNYVPNDDSDGDGVKNDVDAFPTDPAASIDADKDGYPDKWNSGRTQKDSTTGLILDAFPKDAACYLKTQGSGSKCNYNLAVPNFIPQKTISDGNIVYLLSRDNKRVYRWSIASASYLSPLMVGLNRFGVVSAPLSMALSTDASRLYLGYASGDIQSITLKTDTTEKPFTTVPFQVNLLADAGKYVFAQQADGWGVRYTLNASGGVAEKRNDVNTGNYEWDATSSRAYNLNGYLGYEQIDQATGKVVATGRGNNYVSPGILRVSVNGKFILAANQIFSKTDFVLTNKLGYSPVDAIWLQDGGLVTIFQGDNSTTLQRRNSAMQLLEQITYAGTPVGIFGNATKMSVVVIKNNTVAAYAYVPNNDTDGDGVSNLQDAFPTDPAASVDSDRDGYPDAWNAGKRQSDSTTGLTLDAFPKDTACFNVAHGVNGLCNYAATVPGYIPDQVVSHDGIIYFLSKANKRVYRWSIAKGNYIDPLVVGLNYLAEILPPTTMAVSAAHNRLYLGYSTGAVQYIALNSIYEQPFASVGGSVGGLASVGNYLLAENSPGSWAVHSIFAANGTLQDSVGWSYYSREYAWDPISSRVYFFRDDTSPNDLHYEVVDQESGKITGAGETPYHGDYHLMPPIRVSTNGQRILLGSGDIYNADGLTWASSLGGIVADARWLADGSLLSLRGNNGSTNLQRRNANFQIVEQRVFEGTPVGIYGSPEKMVIVVINNGTVATYSYAPSDDIDGDGVDNTTDAFPQDPAASVDSDRDGYPDQWNAGYTAADSTSGLTLDAYPNDAACSDSSQGNHGVCDYNAAVPAFTPDQIESDGSTIYLLSAANKRIYRWSIANNAYINPLVVGLVQGAEVLAPEKMALSAAHGRMYLGYQTGVINYIALNDAAEKPFANTAMSVRGLASVGNYVLAQDPSGAWATHYVFALDGNLVAHKDWNYYSHEYAWDPINSRVYFFRDDTSPNDLHYETIDQANGAISGEGETPYHGDYPIYGVIRVSADGTKIILGSGDIYRTQDLTIAGRLGKTVIDAQWVGNMLVTAEASGVVNLRDAGSLQVQTSYQAEGEIIKLVTDGSDVIVIRSVSGALNYSRISLGDNDGDGLPKWWEDMYGLSDSDASDALLDSDTDGLNNLAEFAQATTPTDADTDKDGINDGNEVNTYHTNPLKADTDADGLSDASEINSYGTDPLVADTDLDGFNDNQEITVYGTDPRDANSKPAALTSMRIGI